MKILFYFPTLLVLVLSIGFGNNKFQVTGEKLLCQCLFSKSLCANRNATVDPCFLFCRFWIKSAESECKPSGYCMCTYPNPHPEHVCKCHTPPRRLINLL
ncbi:uncharacterized protein DS421_18g620440 [Arachis hypogaea]|nr:uncharacterized protein DS421_18g620440 [Arachis hypogaea]